MCSSTYLPIIIIRLQPLPHEPDRPIEFRSKALALVLSGALFMRSCVLTRNTEPMKRAVRDSHLYLVWHAKRIKPNVLFGQKAQPNRIAK